MLINVARIKNEAQSSMELDITEQVDAAACGFPELLLQGPLHFTGRIINAAPYLQLSGRLSARLELSCSRCLQPLERSFKVDIAESYTNKPEVAEADDGGEVILFEGDEIDITPVMLNALFGELPMHPLCRQDCRGLCPECGADLNRSDCTCQQDNIDIRLEKLRTLWDAMNKEV